MNESIEKMLGARTFAVVGASTNPDKYGNIIYHDLKNHGKTVYPVNPHADVIDGDPCFATVGELPEKPDVVVMVVPPVVTETLIEDIAAADITHVWMQPGAESGLAIEKAVTAGIDLVAGGPCIMVSLRTHPRH